MTFMRKVHIKSQMRSIKITELSSEQINPIHGVLIYTGAVYVHLRLLILMNANSDSHPWSNVNE